MQDEITVAVRGHTRRVRLREVQYTCQQCDRDCRVQQHLGRPPRYCPACRQQLEHWRRLDGRDAAAARMRRLRASRQASQPTPHPDDTALKMLRDSRGYQDA